MWSAARIDSPRVLNRHPRVSNSNRQFAWLIRGNAGISNPNEAAAASLKFEAY
ncbi:MAG: hypothetical protein JWP25_6993 [Bradyrhizobium sp.]|nr:hypothetical protein [Bradyrhizobium sp.]MEA2865395.1 hypothetical protein [Bradyrhizobium sp.]